MTKGPDNITRRLRARREALLLAYDPEDLHKLRINIRRARAVLKSADDQRLASLRNRWGSIAQQTNAARDWDTLSAFARETLPKHQWRHLQALFDARRARAHEQVLTTLQSWQWQDAMRDWERLTEDATPDNPLGEAQTSAGRNPAKRVLKMGRRALAEQDERSWHRFRIAVKNLRYMLDGARAHKNLRGRHEAVGRTCKRLQDTLGDWHDTVVHRALLDGLMEDDRPKDQPETLAALQQLRAGIEGRREQTLARVKQTLKRDADTLASAVDLF